MQPRATFKFPSGEVSLQEREEEEEDVKRTLSVNGILKGQVLNGICTAQYNEEELKLRYSYKVVFSWLFLLASYSWPLSNRKLKFYPTLVNGIA